ncbi:MAG: (4Fe-4S)-binding protein [Anaerolineae bacterium]|jgi:MinD superfamily P-loop ATPase|nr:MAG: (4Fe-4S)-binding protein [Anaerolineae bacterium]
MKQLVILSGKGGTGKTSLTAALAHLAAQDGWKGRIVLADADVDAANLELVLKPFLIESQNFIGGKVAIIQTESCSVCGTCAFVCRFDAVLSPTESTDQATEYHIDPLACEGCASCVYQCPTHSISLQEQVAGKFHYSESLYGPLYHAHLFPGQENSGKLVTLVKQRARLDAFDNQRDLIIVDGPPGIGCPVISAISGADLALIVTEPSVSGIHDLQRILQTLQHFGVPPLVVINKADLVPQATVEIQNFCKEKEIEVIGTIPFDLAIPRALVASEIVTAVQPEAPASLAIRQVWRHLSSRYLGAL